MSTSKKNEAKVDETKVEARPIGSGKDPLAEGDRLKNPTNSEAETHYEADTSERKAEERASKIRGQDANERAEEHNAEARVESQPVDDTAQEDTPERTEDDQVKEDTDHADTVEKQNTPAKK